MLALTKGRENNLLARYRPGGGKSGEKLDDPLALPPPMFIFDCF